MTRSIIIILALLFTLSSCKSDHTDSFQISDNLYFGTFQRAPVWSTGDIAQISITFSSGTWTGISNKTHYPALCHGTYKIVNQKIIFTNDCVWTADFDWSFILSGEYDLKIVGHQIEFSKDYRGSSTDTYVDRYVLMLLEN